jgi:hypothetical protein
MPKVCRKYAKYVLELRAGPVHFSKSVPSVPNVGFGKVHAQASDPQTRKPDMVLTGTVTAEGDQRFLSGSIDTFGTSLGDHYANSEYLSKPENFKSALQLALSLLQRDQRFEEPVKRLMDAFYSIPLESQAEIDNLLMSGLSNHGALLDEWKSYKAARKKVDASKNGQSVPKKDKHTLLENANAAERPFIERIFARDPKTEIVILNKIAKYINSLESPTSKALWANPNTKDIALSKMYDSTHDMRIFCHDNADESTAFARISDQSHPIDEPDACAILRKLRNRNEEDSFSIEVLRDLVTHNVLADESVRYYLEM